MDALHKASAKHGLLFLLEFLVSFLFLCLVSYHHVIWAVLLCSSWTAQRLPGFLFRGEGGSSVKRKLISFFIDIELCAQSLKCDIHRIFSVINSSLSWLTDDMQQIMCLFIHGVTAERDCRRRMITCYYDWHSGMRSSGFSDVWPGAVTDTLAAKYNFLKEITLQFVAMHRN